MALINTRGIVLQQFKFSESAIIVKIYTEELGLQSYMIKGSRSRKSEQKAAYFEPLSLLEMVVYHKENKNLQSIKELKSAYPWRNIPFHIEKQSILLFLNEILYKTLREESPNKSLFEFIFNSLSWFDLEENNYLNFHLFFLLQLSRYLGFLPKTGFADNNNSYFDLQEGFFSTIKPLHPYYIEGKISADLRFLVNQNIETLKTFSPDTIRRLKLLDALVIYFQIHLPEMGEVKSLKILRNIFH